MNCMFSPGSKERCRRIIKGPFGGKGLLLETLRRHLLKIFVQISPFSLPAKRTKELRALTGWRYYFSLVLEFSDITMPFLRAVCTKISNAVSFFLVCMIGRSVGLIFTGIRQSLAGGKKMLFSFFLLL
uniref:Uncharacterized protein n=1 Tax=Ananas comosus var. bracteatus TaxID=296719 RepID=A0A6V7NNE2_ANACO|nr:unnamed protein product [Ananas comosus var. bracteatus]